MRTRRRQRLEMVKERGGACERCGYSRCQRALQFHHRDASEKAEWSKGRGHAEVAEIVAHPERFTLLCANCHFEEHDAIDLARRVYTPCQACGAPVIAERARSASGRGRFCSRACRDGERMRRARAGESVAPRFQKYAERGPSERDCWRWTGPVSTRTGQGIIPIVRPDGGRAFPAARRVGYELRHGPQAGRIQLRAVCGRDECVNPGHMVIRGSDADRRDREAREQRGECEQVPGVSSHRGLPLFVSVSR